MANKTAPKPVQRRGPAPEKTVEIDSATAAMIFFGIALVYFLPALMPGRHIYGSDYIEAGYMMYEFARQRIVSGSLPKWVPYILGGLPMFANPGSVFYPLRLLTNFLLPGTLSLPIIFIFQFGIAGFGMYLLARELGCRTWVSFIAGIAFQLTGITISAVYAGHDGRVIVATFAPLFLFFLHRGIRTGSFAAFVGAAAALGFSLLSFQIQSNYYVLLAGAAWAAFLLVHLGIIKMPRALATRVVLGLGAVVFAFAIAAVNFLPFRDYVADSPRGAARGYTYSTTWSLPPAELVGMAVPEHVGVFDAYKGKNPFKINTEYVGVFVLVLLVLGFAVSRRNRYWWFFLGVMVIALTIAMGGHTPIYRLYYEILPGTKRFRAPSVSFFLIAVSLAAMAALTLERIAQMYDERKGTSKRSGRDIVSSVLAVSAGAVIAIAVIASVTQGLGGSAGAAAGFARFAIFTVLLCLAMWLWWSRALRTHVFVVMLAIITVADLMVVNRKFFSTVDSPDTMFAQDGLISFFLNAPKPYRLWIFPSNDGTESNVFMLFGVEQAGGEHGNQLQRYNEYVGQGTKTYIDWHNMIEKSNFVNAANIRYLVSRAEIPLSGADTLVMRERYRGGGFVYENLKALPRAYVVDSVIATPDTTAALVYLADSTFNVARKAVVYTSEKVTLPATPLESKTEVVEHTPDRVVIRAQTNRPAMLVLADNFHKDWRATVNGHQTPILRANHTFRAVMIGTGNNDVIFEFHPQSLYTGFYIYLVSLILLSAYAVWLIATRLRKKH
jgi:hypothetical protein